MALAVVNGAGGWWVDSDDIIVGRYEGGFTLGSYRYRTEYGVVGLAGLDKPTGTQAPAIEVRFDSTPGVVWTTADLPAHHQGGRKQ